MPTYEYRCPAGHTFEKFYPTMKNSRRVKCPTCGKLAGRQISGGAGLVFKGSGFYITDYKRAGEKQSDHKDDAKPATEPKPATETKPADSAKKKKDPGDK
jgi:putative FmdB family regulatory protein